MIKIGWSGGTSIAEGIIYAVDNSLDFRGKLNEKAFYREIIGVLTDADFDDIESVRTQSQAWNDAVAEYIAEVWGCEED